jgi:hypothetical protein
MQRVSYWTDLVTPEGEFRYGSLAGGQPPTPLKAEWLNVIQAELANFILAYLPALDALDNEQLLKAARQLIANLAVKATTLAGYGIGDAYTKNQTDFLLSGKANWGITLAAYGIGDAYTKTAVDGLLAGKANWGGTLAAYGIGDAYTKTTIDAALAGLWNDGNAIPKAIVAQASAEAGGVGTYALLLIGGSGASGFEPLYAGSLIAGSSCLFTNSGTQTSAGTPAGTWKLMGMVYNHDAINPDSSTLCLRVS